MHQKNAEVNSVVRLTEVRGNDRRRRDIAINKLGRDHDLKVLPLPMLGCTSGDR